MQAITTKVYIRIVSNLYLADFFKNVLCFRKQVKYLDICIIFLLFIYEFV
jgi:hypothetical protein